MAKIRFTPAQRAQLRLTLVLSGVLLVATAGLAGLSWHANNLHAEAVHTLSNSEETLSTLQKEVDQAAATGTSLDGRIAQLEAQLAPAMEVAP